MYIKLTEDKMYIEYYDSEKECHIPAVTAKNHVAILFKPEVAKKAVTEFISAMGLEVISENNLHEEGSPRYVQLEVTEDLPW